MLIDDVRLEQPFPCEQRMFGACEPDSMRLKLIVEAASMEDAYAYIGLVSPLVGMQDSAGLVVVQLDSALPGVPTFLKAFFTAGNISFNRARVAPGSSTLQ